MPEDVRAVLKLLGIGENQLLITDRQPICTALHCKDWRTALKRIDFYKIKLVYDGQKPQISVIDVILKFQGK